MRFKLDENLAPSLASLFEQAGHEADTVLGESISGAKDDDIFLACRKEGRCLVTLDLDFSNPLRYPPLETEGVVILRPARPILPLIRGALTSLIQALSERSVQGKLWIVEPGRIREYEPRPPSDESNLE